MPKKQSYTGNIVAMRLKEKATAMETAYNQEFELRQKQMKEMHALREQAEAYKKKYEDLLIRFVKMNIDLKSARASADYYGKELISTTTAMFERGARRAEVDEHYAVFRELLLSGKELTQENFMALVKANPNAHIPGLVQVAEEFGMKLSIDLVSRDIAKTFDANFETTKNEDGTWKVEATFKDMVAYVSAKEE